MTELQIRILTLEDMSQPDIQTQMETISYLDAIISNDDNTPTSKFKHPKQKYVWSCSGVPVESKKRQKRSKDSSSSLNIKTLVKDRILEVDLPRKYKPYVYRECVAENICGQFQCVVDKRPFQVCLLYLFYLFY